MIRIKPKPPVTYVSEPSLQTMMAWAICEQVYAATPDQKTTGIFSNCTCAKNGRNIACSIMDNAAMAAKHQIAEYYKDKT